MSVPAVRLSRVTRRIPVATWFLAAWAVGSALLIAHSGIQSRSAFLHVAVPVLLVPLAAWLFFSPHIERTLAVLMLYLGLLDGVVKLASGSTTATLGRDVLLYSITLGAITRIALRKPTLEIPRMTGIVLAWIAVCLMQVANPNGISIAHSVAALRQHIEFVPLFFFGYFVLRTERRLYGLLFLLLLIGAANGIADLVQSQLTPAQLGSWGPGYHLLETNNSLSVARVFYVDGQAKVRPPGLGGEDGFGGMVGALALPAAIAMLTGARRSARLLWLVAPATALALFGIASSEARLSLISAAIGVASYLLLTMTSQRGFGVLLLVFVVGIGGYEVITSFVSSNSNRYATIAPSHIIHTSLTARSNSFDVIPTYLIKYPLGAGLGSVGPAEHLIGGTGDSRVLNGETEPPFLLVETGIPGLLVMVALLAVSLRAAVALRRVADPSVQRALMAIAAILVILFAACFIEAVTADSPGAPMLWLASGCVSYWYSQARGGRIPLRRRWLAAARDA